MTYRGKVTGGVVVLDEGVRLPEGTVVTVIPKLPQTPGTESGDTLYRITEFAAPTGISDLALNIDHYLYGHPKVGDAEQ